MSGKNNNIFIKSNKSLIYLNILNRSIPYYNGRRRNIYIFFKQTSASDQVCAGSNGLIGILRCVHQRYNLMRAWIPASQKFVEPPTY